MEINQEYLNILSEKGFISLINRETRPESGTCIDHIFIRSRIENYENLIAAVLNTNITDHFSQAVQYNQVINLNQHKTIPVKKYYNKINEKKFLQLIRKETWHEVYESLDVEQGCDILITKINVCMKQATEIFKTRHFQKKKPWITKGLVISIKKRDKLFQNYIRNPMNDELKKTYLTYRNKLNALIKKTKYEYFKNKIEKNRNCSKVLWNVVNEYTNTNRKENSNTDKLVLDNGDEVTDKIMIANEYNKFFSSIGTHLASKIDRKNVHRDIEERTLSQSIFLEPTDPREIKNII